VQLESIISRPIVLCPPSISADSTTGEAILFGECLTGLQGLWSPLGWQPTKQQPEPLLLQRSLSQEPLQVIIQETEPMSVLQPTPLQEPVEDVGFLNGGKCRRHEDRGEVFPANS